MSNKTTYPPAFAKPIELRDFSKGRITKYSVNPFLIPKNSVSDCMNVNFDTIIGSGVVRQGTLALGSVIASNKTPLGFTNLVGAGGSPNLLLAVLNGASTASLYYFDTSWHTSTVTNLTNDNKVRFAQLGNRVYRASVDGMLGSSDGNNWDYVNTPAYPTSSSDGTQWEQVIPSLVFRAKSRLLVGGNTNFYGISKDRIYFSTVINKSQIKKTVTTLTNLGSNTFDVVCIAHGFSTGDSVTITGASPSTYNTTGRVSTILNANEFYIKVYENPVSSPATGTIYIAYADIGFNTDTVKGDWIDINPDDGGTVTAFGETSNQTIVFKNNGMYRLDVITKSVDVQNIFNIGAQAQEGVITCQGVCYFFSGIDIRMTDGGYPTQISRLGVQDYIDAIPQSYWTNVAAGTDGFNVYFSIGNITLNTNKNNQKSYTNVVLKFSPRDESWSVHSYAQQPRFFTSYTTTTGLEMTSLDSSGFAQVFNSGHTDNGSEIFYNLETQDVDFGNRAHSNSFNDKIAVFCTDGAGSQLQARADDGDYKDITDTLQLPVNVVDGLDHDGHYFTFKWFGSTKTSSPVFDGLYMANITDDGLTMTNADGQ